MQRVQFLSGRPAVAVDALVAACLALLGGGVLHLVMGQFFPSPQGSIGHDFSAFLPRLLDGYYWYLTNGWFPAPWFTPSFCGGTIAFPEPHTIFYSLPMVATVALGPLAGAYASILIAGGLGAAGFYLLLRHGFGLGLAASLFGAVCWLTNDFFVTRMIVGHLSFQPFALLPWLALAALGPRAAIGWRGHGALIVFGGLLTAYMVHAGLMNMLTILGAGLIGLMLLQGAILGATWAPWLRLLAIGGLGASLAASKLSAFLSFFSQIARTQYPLPGFANPLDLLTAFAQSLLTTPDADWLNVTLSNHQVYIGPWELDYRLPWIAVGLSVAALAWGVVALRRAGRGRRLMALGVLAVLIMPLAVNFYAPGWTAFLKSVPVVGSSSNLFRWWAVYLPMVAAGAAWGLAKLPVRERWRPVLCGALCLIALGEFLGRDLGFLGEQHYRPSGIEAGYQAAKASGKAPEVTKNVVYHDRAGRLVAYSMNLDDSLTLGASHIHCIDPLFGYRLENRPIKTLRPGPALGIQGGVVNLKNPACYVFGAANDCAFGDHFPATRLDDARRFVRHQPYAFVKPPHQIAADWLNGLAFAGAALFLLFAGGTAWRRGKG